MLRKTIKTIWVIVIIFVLIINSEIKAFSSTNIKKTINVGVILFSLDNSIMQQLKQELENLQEENQIKVSVFDAQNNISLQNQILDSLLKSKVDLIITMPVDTRENSVRDFISRVKPYSIPLIMFDITPEVVKKVSKDYDKVAFTIPDSEKAGEMQGEIISDFWNNNSIKDKKGDGTLQYVLLRGPTNDIIANMRIKGLNLAIEKSGMKTELIQSLATNWTKEIAKSYIENIFITYSSKIDAIIANDDDLAVGAIEALQKYGYNKGDNSKIIPVFGIDGSSEAKKLIDKGLMSATVGMDLEKVAQDFYTIGINLVNNVNPIENTNLKSEDGVIIIETNLKKYIK
ncbi:galactose ABC transporter substrate-binding protein [Clostridium sp. SHJSY1]|uniref:galactose ABC transporter substrate-binding protein n=1 Tax=Clostridium sp. SHJSY1 TaxID=2942483 RepID=UPI002875D87D|nr:galactose ABC transporter substrate-binding protein [Clostridium sp. SHJSY1]MDS0528049.1 galactose ABC transporter substrate-binding protein [Clostridium sp. SHJSY1]